MKIFNAVDSALKEQGRSYVWLAKRLNISRATLYEWRLRSFDVRMTREQITILDDIIGFSNARSQEINIAGQET